MRRVAASVVLASALAFALAPPAPAGPTTQPGHHHGAAGDGVTSFDVWADGARVHLLSVHANTSSDKSRAFELRYSRSSDAGASWSQPVVVGRDQPPPEIARRGMDVQLAAAGDKLLAVWTAKGTKDRFGRGPLVTSVSSDGGRTWRAGANPADDGDPELGRAFADVAADARGAFHLVWLDGRWGDGKKGLIYARSTDGGATWSKNKTLDDACCECCWNVVTCAPDGTVYVLYRDIAPRDMSLVRSDDGGQTWTAPVTVGRFNWETDSCPHVGGALAMLTGQSNRSLHALVWTGHSTSSGAYALASPDEGATWAEPLPLGGPSSGAWHVDVAHNGDVLAAVWDAYTDTGTAVLGATSRDAGATWSAPRRLSDAGGVATHPRVFPSGAGFRVMWTEQRAGLPTRAVVRVLE